jgi:hypothetical protein
VVLEQLPVKALMGVQVASGLTSLLAAVEEVTTRTLLVLLVATAAVEGQLQALEPLQN